MLQDEKTNQIRLSNQLSNLNLYDPTYNEKLKNRFKGIYFNFSYKRVINYIKLVENHIFDKAEIQANQLLYILDYTGDGTDLYDNIFNDLYTLFKGSRYSVPFDDELTAMYKEDNMDEEEYINWIKFQKNFDDLDDYDLIWSLFIEKFGINLEMDTINWFEYKFHLENLLLSENSLTRRIGFRGYEPKDGKVDKNQETLKIKYDIYEPPEVGDNNVK